MTKPINELIQEHLKSGDYSGWFDEVYRRAQDSNGKPPWAYMQPTPDLVEWAETVQIDGTGKRAVVVGCGMGDDAEYAAKLGYEVIGFDVSQKAIELCLARFPDSTVTYQVVDLFKRPKDWYHRFDLVIENRTIQALPHKIYQQSMTAIANLVAENGTVLILSNGRDPEQPTNHIPWGLSRKELAYFQELGLQEQHFNDIQAGSVRRFVVQYQSIT